MKNKSLFLIFAALVIGTSSCSKIGDDVIDATANYPLPPANYVKSQNLTGVLKGTLKQDSIYYLTGNVAVKKGDTLAVQQGATIIAKGNYQFQVSGTLLCLGTEAKQITFTSNTPSKLSDVALNKGQWGGFVFDSTAVYIYMRYTHVNYTGGPDSGGSPQASFDVVGSQTYNGGAHIVVEDCWFFGGIDDGIHLVGNISVSIKRNVIQHLGGPDGESMNMKAGLTGDISYNYIWSAANNGIKLETGKTVLIPQSKLNIYNNTIVNGGWRKVGEATNSILIDKWARANIYNNVMVGNNTGINITTKADTANTKYGYNLIFAINAASAPWIYPAGASSKKQPSDITGATAELCNSVFTTWIPPVTTLPDNTVTDSNVPSLKTGSPAIGKGLATAPFSYFITGSLNGKNGTADQLNKDMGAYPTDGTGNKHLPTSQPIQ
ncbi:MAG: hypothetical protein WCK18_09190 [Prolixibacteraceae bacterium]